MIDKLEGMAAVAHNVSANSDTPSSAPLVGSLLFAYSQTVENYYSAAQETADLVASMVNITAVVRTQLSATVVALAPSMVGVASSLPSVLGVLDAAHLAGADPAVLKAAVSVGRLLGAGITSASAFQKQYPALKADSVGLWLAAGAATDPLTQQAVSFNAPLQGLPAGAGAQVCNLVGFAADAPVLLDAVLQPAWHEEQEAAALVGDLEYLEISVLERAGC